MKEKLTLTISKETKDRAKRYAQRQGISVSKMVETFLNSISAAEEDPVKYLGKSPVKTGTPDASKNHDQYICTSDK
ncbi:MAG TPA: DUF6364 family protein [Balneolales bacterium]|nr:DUF6364 family protein [Balneolales bacterium]